MALPSLDRHLQTQVKLLKLRRWQDGKGIYADWRQSRGCPHTAPILLTHPDASAKLIKADLPNYGFGLSPASSSGMWNTCVHSTPLCEKGCLNTAGRGEMDIVQDGRLNKTLFLGEHPDAALPMLDHEVELAIKRHDDPLLWRPNVTSEIQWEKIMPHWFDPSRSDVLRPYDYTKNWRRALRSVDWDLNYVLVYSASERDTDVDLMYMLDAGVNVAIVFDTHVPDVWWGYKVIDGDQTDDRYHDPRGCVVGLKAKGRMRKDTESYIPFIRRAA